MKINIYKFLTIIIIFFTMCFFTNCGPKDVTGNSNKIFSFTSTGNPVNNSVYLEKSTVNNDQIILVAKIKGGLNIYGVILEITYDSSKIKYVSSTPGDYLGNINDILFYPFLIKGQEGRLHIAVDKKGTVAGANGDGILAVITLKALSVQTNTVIGFDTTISNLIPSNSNVPILRTSWLGGSLSYR